ncbi:MAG: hypothetical protein PHP03_00375 [Candidatus Pacebacteria bacterium]|nr:hypothetical protein [Candidatus Paceibacterota bacterium]
MNKENNVTNDNVQKEKNENYKYEYDFEYVFSTREGLLAKELAEGLNDTKNIRYYISAAMKHQEDFLWDIYARVMEIPLHKVRKSRGALFAYLVKKHGKDNPGN